MPWYYRVRNAINAATPFLVPTQQTNPALLVSAILKTRTLCLSELARTYPTPKERCVAAPKTANERVDALQVQLAFVPHVLARLGHPGSLGWPSPGSSATASTTWCASRRARA